MQALNKIKVLEFAGLAPAPYCGMILSDFGADVIKIDRAVPAGLMPPNNDTLSRGKRSIALNLKKARAIALIKRLVATSDVLIEPYRPGKMEKLGLGPEILCTLNPRLIYARLTGYGQNGLFKNKAGHDINYCAMSGLLGSFGRSSEPPITPLNLLADMAGGGLLCAFGIVAALVQRERTGEGAIIDASMTDGAAYIGSFVFNSKDSLFPNARGANLLDTGAPFYDTYKTKDNKYMAVGALESQFYTALLQALQLSEDEFPQFDQEKWPLLRKALKKTFATKTRAEWEKIFITIDACVTPVLEMNEDLCNEENAKSRHRFNANNEVNPQPTFSSSSTSPPSPPTKPLVGQHTLQILQQTLHLSQQEIQALLQSGVAYANHSAKL